MQKPLYSHAHHHQTPELQLCLLDTYIIWLHMRGTRLYTSYISLRHCSFKCHNQKGKGNSNQASLKVLLISCTAIVIHKERRAVLKAKSGTEQLNAQTKVTA
jgi:hypothetical protein